MHGTDPTADLMTTVLIRPDRHNLIAAFLHFAPSSDLTPYLGALIFPPYSNYNPVKRQKIDHNSFCVCFRGIRAALFLCSLFFSTE
ncbi:unnamed protein product [Protopolystoma xenopodis]|uniref:Uncharacterized protein n=1 Tax=Protopolystoma xenopodis TaxID=117903 RepID=A0A448XDD7_9PLAT|nr:unnamed protein product [Protopolystoma xenopodis]